MASARGLQSSSGREGKVTLAVVAALSIWIAGFVIANIWIAVNLLLLPGMPITAGVFLLVYLLLLLSPLDVRPPRLAQRFLRFSLRAASDYFPVMIHYEDRGALKGGRPYVVGYEPHSVLPLGISAFCRYAAETPPPGLINSRILVSTAGFWAPVIRHLWWWLGCRPAGRRTASALLQKGRTIILCPGGVQECLFMQHGKEVAFLRKRYGFVRLALEHGAPLVPVFAFGQTQQYKWVRLPFAAKIARKIGWVPMLVFGLKGTAMPRKIPLRIVVGKPIEVPHMGHGKATTEMIETYLQEFIRELEDMYERYRQMHFGDANFPQLTVY